ncbi:MAG TPA: acyltransferase family protein [Acidimicrobiales bacterium]|nr:acyltransferase family protein [Acidimicrobiales bacterium]
MGRRRTFAYQPALDGVRALAIVLVLVFHLGYDWMPGGYLGVSVFFTLSGFLITSLLLTEARQRRRIRARAFYARRIRRLLPASLVCLAGISLLIAVGVPAMAGTPRSDILGALLQVTNWQRLVAHQSYADLFRSPSPVAHFWSLAIEEQFYWVWPMAMAAMMAWAARHRRSMTGPLVGCYVVFSGSALLTARYLSADAVYYASWSRFAEILAGAALAAVIAGRTVPRRAVLLAPLCLAAIVALAVVTPSADGWAYEGGLPLFALLTVGLVIGLQPASPLREALSYRPIVWVGRVSYELYLFHWPVFLLVSEETTGLHGFELSAVRLGITVAVSAAVFHAIEQPVRTRRVLARTRPMFAGAATCVVALLVAVELFVPPGPPRHGARPTVLAATHLAPVATAAPSASAVAPAPASVAPPTTPRSTTVAIFGDSVADWLLRDAASSYVRSDYTLVNGAHEACDGVINLPTARDRRGKSLYAPADCQEWPQSYPPVVEDPAQPVEIAVLVLGQAPYPDHLFGDQWLGPCDTMGWYTTDLIQRIAYVRQHVGQVVLALPSWSGAHVTFMMPDDHRARMACIRTALQAMAESTHVPVVDLASLLCPAGPDGECAPFTSDDGVHVNSDQAPFVLNWLLDSLPVTRNRRDTQ